MSVLSEAALVLAEKGKPVIPLWWPTSRGCACGDSLCGNVGKHPIGKLAPNGSLSASSDPAIVASWWRRFTEANIGLVSGERAGFFVLDVDPRHGGHVTLEDLEARHGRLPASIRSKTGSGGLHILFAWPYYGSVGNSSNRLGAGLDVRGEGGYIAAPPSLHKSGARYTWLDVDTCLLEDAPGWLLPLVLRNVADPNKPDPFKGALLPPAAARGLVGELFARMAEQIEAGVSRHNSFGGLLDQARDNRVPREIVEEIIDDILRLCRTGDPREVNEKEVRARIAWTYSAARMPREPFRRFRAALEEAQR